jgi:hypothetical protein
MEQLRSWQRRVHEPYIAIDPSRLGRLWNWPRYYAASHFLNDAHGCSTTAYQLLVAAPSPRAIPVGMAMLVSGLSRRNDVRGLLLSLFRGMGDPYFVYDEASAHACTLRWNHLR